MGLDISFRCCEAMKEACVDAAFELTDAYAICLGGCCGGGCFIFTNMKFCPFCATELEAIPPIVAEMPTDKG